MFLYPPFCIFCIDNTHYYSRIRPGDSPDYPIARCHAAAGLFVNTRRACFFRDFLEFKADSPGDLFERFERWKFLNLVAVVGGVLGAKKSESFDRLIFFNYNQSNTRTYILLEENKKKKGGYNHYQSA